MFHTNETISVQINGESYVMHVISVTMMAELMDFEPGGTRPNWWLSVGSKNSGHKGQ
jgi:hypothetical protein